MTAAGDGGGSVADFTRLKAPLHTAGSTGGIILGSIRENRQLVQKIHHTLKRYGACAASAGPDGRSDA